MKIIYTVIAALGLLSATSCQDMLSVDNDSMIKDPSLNQKIDSVYYALGIAQAMQQAADQYFFVGEMRGELVSPTTYANTNLKQLADYSASTANAYDSAYVYYKVINNCNYYLAHRDTTLYTGATNVTINEYAAVAAWRAWAYLQLCRTYCGNASEGIPFFTKPITQISEIQEDNFPKKNIKGIVEELAPELEKFSAMHVQVPNFGRDTYGVGKTNWGQTKNISPSCLFVPVDVILGEMYLEDAQYLNAAKKYAKYLTENNVPLQMLGSFRFPENNMGFNAPVDLGTYNAFALTYTGAFSNMAKPTDALCYIPMAVSKTQGKTTNVPLAFGYDYYSTDASSNCPRVENPQLAPSKTFYTLTDSAVYYYYPKATDKNGTALSYPIDVRQWKCGDGRACYSDGRGDNKILNRDAADSTKVYIGKNKTANIILYRNSTIYLHFAEAVNRAGYPDLAFAVLKNGISDYLKDLVMRPVLQKTEAGDTLYDEAGEPVYKIPAYTYLRQETYDALEGELLFLNAENVSKFPCENVYGIHAHGASTIWELWNGDTANPAMNSGNHVMLLGDLLLWYYEDLAGIRQMDGTQGYRHLDMRPCFPQQLHHVKASYRSVSGLIRSEWQKDGNHLTWQIEVPANTQARLTIPSRFRVFPCTGKGIHKVAEQDGCTIIEVGSGKYKFETEKY